MKAYVTGEPHICTVDLTPSDTVLILACDGVWDVIDDQEAVDFVSKLPNAQAMAEGLVKRAMEKFTTDNITVVVILL